MREADEPTESGKAQVEEFGTQDDRMLDVDRKGKQEEEMAVGDSDNDDNVSMLTPLRDQSDEEEAIEEVVMRQSEK